VKADGLAAGKGVHVGSDLATAQAFARDALVDEGTRVIVEQYLDGPEVSLFALSDGTTVVPLVPAQDFKRAYDGDAGPNTGGMGAYAPLDWLPDGTVDDVQRRILQPVVDELAKRGMPFAGLLYAGLAITARGPQVIEFNCRFGDPETQVVLALLETPLAGLLHAARRGRSPRSGPLAWRSGSAVTVVVAAEGYPGAVASGDAVEVGALPGRGRRAARGHPPRRGRGGERRRAGGLGDRRRRRPGAGARSAYAGWRRSRCAAGTGAATSRRPRSPARSASPVERGTARRRPGAGAPGLRVVRLER
jgi:hypothetical protein